MHEGCWGAPRMPKNAINGGMIGPRLRALRGRRFSQIGLARVTGLKRGVIGLLENDHRSPRLDELEHLAEALDVSVLDFLPRYRSRAAAPWEIVATRLGLTYEEG